MTSITYDLLRYAFAHSELLQCRWHEATFQIGEEISHILLSNVARTRLVHRAEPNNILKIPAPAHPNELVE